MEQAPTAASVRTDTLEVLGMRTRLLRVGPEPNGEAVLLVHGGPGSADDWADLLPRIGSFAPAVAVDLPGFGEADKPANWSGYVSAGWATFIAAVVNRLELDKVHVVAQDMGGDAACTWAAAHPGSLASALLINTGVLIGYRWHLIARLHRVPLFGYIPAWCGRMGLRTVMRLYEPRLPRHVVDRWHGSYDWGTRRALLRFYRATPTSGGGRVAEDLSRLDRPALVIWGANNRFVPVEQAERQRKSFPSASVEILENSGHYSHLDSPDRVAGLALPFLRDQLAGMGGARVRSARPGA